jgi:hypothetical protein
MEVVVDAMVVMTCKSVRASVGINNSLIPAYLDRGKLIILRYMVDNIPECGVDVLNMK